MLVHKPLEKETYQEFDLSFWCTQQDRPSEAKSGAFDRLLESDSIGAYILDTETLVDNSLIYRHTRNSTCDHKLEIGEKD